MDTRSYEIMTKNARDAYRERNQLVAALSRIFPAHLARHPDEDTAWDDDWRWIVCVHINTGMEKRFETVQSQATWHIHDSEINLFPHLDEAPNDWDGHSTEEKYNRLRHIVLKETPQRGYVSQLWHALWGQR